MKAENVHQPSISHIGKAIACCHMKIDMVVIGDSIAVGVNAVGIGGA